MTGFEIIVVLVLLTVLIIIIDADTAIASFFGVCLLVGAGFLTWHGSTIASVVVHFLLQDPLRTALLGVGYLIGGCLTIPLRWYWYCLERREQGHRYPVVRTEVERIVRWGTFWPITLVWNLVWNTFKYTLKNFFRRMILKYEFVLTDITEKVFGKNAS